MVINLISEKGIAYVFLIPLSQCKQTFKKNPFFIDITPSPPRASSAPDHKCISALLSAHTNCEVKLTAVGFYHLSCKNPKTYLTVQLHFLMGFELFTVCNVKNLSVHETYFSYQYSFKLSLNADADVCCMEFGTLHHYSQLKVDSFDSKCKCLLHWSSNLETFWFSLFTSQVIPTVSDLLQMTAQPLIVLPPAEHDIQPAHRHCPSQDDHGCSGTQLSLPRHSTEESFLPPQLIPALHPHCFISQWVNSTNSR